MTSDQRDTLLRAFNYHSDAGHQARAHAENVKRLGYLGSARGYDRERAMHFEWAAAIASAIRDAEAAQTALESCVDALARCYDVLEWPGDNGISRQSKALQEGRAALDQLRQPWRSGQPSEPTAAPSPSDTPGPAADAAANPSPSSEA